MKRRSFLLGSAATLFGSRSSQAAFAIFQTYGSAGCSPSITKNMVSDYLFDATGATDNTSKYYTNAKPDMAGQCAVTHNYNAGSYRFGSFFAPFGIIGQSDLTVNMTGATLNDGGSGGAGGTGIGPPYASGHIGQIGIDASGGGNPAGFYSPGGKSARIQTVSAGATSVSLTTTGLPGGAGSAGAGHISRFSIGSWIMVCGWAIQGTFQSGYSFPPNFHYWDFVKITNIIGDTIYFSGHPLTFYYDASWPEINRGTPNEVDGAGPASIFAMSPDWDGTTTINGGTFDVTAAGSGSFINSYRREVYINNNTQVGKTLYPSVQRLFKAVNSPATNILVEHDKLVDLVDVSGGAYNAWKVQSSSTKLLKIDGASFNRIEGTGRVAEVSNTTVAGDVTIGPTAYGRGETAIFTNVSIGGLINGGQLKQNAANRGFQECFFMSSGLLTVPMCLGDNVLPFLMPDAAGRHVLFWEGDNGRVGSFRVLSATSDRWPATDNATATIGISTTQNSRTLVTDTPLFTSGDVGKVLFLPGVMLAFSTSNSTISNASPGVVTRTNHGFVANDPFRFTAGSGVLPTGASAGVTYYVLASGLTANTFQFAATPGGTAINTSGGSGTVQTTNKGNIYTFITGYTNSTTVTVFDELTNFSMTSVSRALQYGTCNVYCQTNMAGGLPSLSAISPSGGKIRINVPAGRSVTFTNCTGSDRAVDLSQPGAQGKPLDSYTKRSFDGQTGFSTKFGPAIGLVGSVVSIKVNVITPYTGVGALTVQPVLRGQVGDIYTGSSQFYGGKIDLRTPGERVITVGSTTGAAGADTSLNLTQPFFNHGSYYPEMSRDITAESSATRPTFTIEVITDQGFP